jgi:hypothetical protein
VDITSGRREHQANIEAAIGAMGISRHVSVFLNATAFCAPRGL